MYFFASKVNESTFSVVAKLFRFTSFWSREPVYVPDDFFAYLFPVTYVVKLQPTMKFVLCHLEKSSRVRTGKLLSDTFLNPILVPGFEIKIGMTVARFRKYVPRGIEVQNKNPFFQSQMNFGILSHSGLLLIFM